MNVLLQPYLGTKSETQSLSLSTQSNRLINNIKATFVVLCIIQIKRAIMYNLKNLYGYLKIPCKTHMTFRNLSPYRHRCYTRSDQGTHNYLQYHGIHHLQ